MYTGGLVTNLVTSVYIQLYVQVFFLLWFVQLDVQETPCPHQTCGCGCPCFAGGQFVNTVYLSLLEGWPHLLNDTCVRIAGGLVRLQELRLEC